MKRLFSRWEGTSVSAEPFLVVIILNSQKYQVQLEYASMVVQVSWNTVCLATWHMRSVRATGINIYGWKYGGEWRHGWGHHNQLLESDVTLPFGNFITWYEILSIRKRIQAKFKPPRNNTGHSQVCFLAFFPWVFYTIEILHEKYLLPSLSFLPWLTLGVGITRSRTV